MKLFFVGIIFFLTTSSGHACQPFVHLPDSQILENDRTLRDAKAPETSRIIAYRPLSCSDDPAIRDATLRFALQSTNPDSLRGRALFDLMASMQSFMVTANPVQNPDPDTANFFRSTKGAQVFTIRFVDPTKGCISFNVAGCAASASMTVRGTHVDLSYGYLAGQFDLRSDNALDGLVKFNQGSLFPARIQLF